MTNFKISSSCLDTYDQCKYKFYLRYILKQYPNIPSEYLDFGNLIHQIAEDWTGGTFTEMFAMFQEIYKTPYGFQKDRHYSLPKHYKPKVKKALWNFYNFYNTTLKDLKRGSDYFIEHQIDISKPTYTLFGKIDLLYVSGDVLYLCDYKSSKAVKDYREQLAYYFFLLKLEGITTEEFLDVKMIYLCLDSQEDYYLDEYTLTNKDIEKVRTRLMDFSKGKKLRGEDPEKWSPNITPLCGWCDYQKAGICEKSK